MFPWILRHIHHGINDTTALIRADWLACGTGFSNATPMVKTEADPQKIASVSGVGCGLVNGDVSLGGRRL
jgi:hypothetical protein